MIQQTKSRNKTCELLTVIALFCALGFPGNYETYIGHSGSMMIQYAVFGMELLIMLFSSSTRLMDCKIVNLKYRYFVLYIFLAFVFVDSMLVTSFPKEQFISCFRFSVTALFGLWIADRYSAEEIMFLMYRAQILFVAATLLFLIINPGLSFNHQNNNELSFVGLFTVKNSAGFECCNGLMSQMGLYLVKKEKKESVSTRFVALIAVELVLLIISRAMGALLAAVLACGYVFFWYVFQHARKRLPIGFLYTVISVGFLFSALSILDLLTPFLLGIGKDPTLTGRTKIWEGVINLMQKSHTMTGFGFSMFWRDESAYSMLHSLFRKDSWYSTMMYGTHNAVLELWVDVGLIGLALYFLAILYCFRNTKKASKAQYVLIVSYMIIFTLEGLTERAYTVSNFKTLFLFILLGVGCHCGDFITAKNTNEQSQMISSSAQVAA